MIRALPAALLALLLAAPAAAAERRYSVTDFDRVEVTGPFEVVLTTGRASSARATGSAAALDRVTIDVQGATLRIRPNRSAWGGYPGDAAGPVRIEVGTRDLRTATVIGSGHLAIDRVKGLRVDLSVSGSGRLLVLQVDADNLRLGVLGAGRISAAGSAKQVTASLQGSGDLDAAALLADDVKLTSDTAGTVAIAARRTATVRANGAGDVEISGKPSCTVTGDAAGRVRCGK
jgi:hypothetical protein